MKRKVLIGLLTLVLSQTGFAAGKEIKISVNGMVCAFCAQGITKKFKAEPSVDSVDVRLGDKLVKLSLKDKQEISDDRIEEILKDAGFNVVKIERN